MTCRAGRAIIGETEREREHDTMKEYRPTERDNLYTAYMDYLHFRDRAKRPAPAPQPLTAERKAEIYKAIEAAIDKALKDE